MKLNGSLLMMASSSSEVKHLHLEKVVTNPTITTSDVGRVIYNTTTGNLLCGKLIQGVAEWVSIGGEGGGMQGEIDAIEASLGLKADGTFDPTKFVGNLAGQTSYVTLIARIQQLVATNAQLIDAEIARATGAEQALAAQNGNITQAIETNALAIAAETTRATGAEDAINARLDDVDPGTLRADLDAEILRAKGAEDNNTTMIEEETARATAAEAVLDGKIAAVDTAGIRLELQAEVTRATGAEAQISAEVRAEEQRATAAEVALGVRIDDVDASAIRADLEAEVDRATAAEGVLDGKIDAEKTRAQGVEADIKQSIQDMKDAETWLAPVNFVVPDHTDKDGIPAGQRVLDTTDFKIYTSLAGGGFSPGKALVPGAAFDSLEDMQVYVFDGLNIASVGGGSSVTGGPGVKVTNNRVEIVSPLNTLNPGVGTLDIAPAFVSKVDGVVAGLATETSRATAAEGANATAITDEVTRAMAAEAALGTRIDNANVGQIRNDLTNEITRATREEGLLSDRITDEVTRATAAETALGTRVTATEGVVTQVGVLRTDVNALQADKVANRWMRPVDQMIAAAGDWAGPISIGSRYLNTTDKKIYQHDGFNWLLDTTLQPGAVTIILLTNKEILLTTSNTLLDITGGGGAPVQGDGITITNNVVSIQSSSGTLVPNGRSLDISPNVITQITDLEDAVAANTWLLPVTKMLADHTTSTGDAAGDRILDSTDKKIYTRVTETTWDDGVLMQIGATLFVMSNNKEFFRAADGTLKEMGVAGASEPLAGDGVVVSGMTVSIASTSGTLVPGVGTLDLAPALATKINDTAATVATQTTLINTIGSSLNTEMADRKAGYFLYTSGAAATSHTVTHNIGQKYPTITVINSADAMIFPDSVQFVDANSLTVTFNTAITCKVAVSGTKP